MSEVLKPCPFCGGEAEVSMRDSYCPDEGYYASCTHGNYWNGFHCHVGPITETFDTAEEAIETWNTRAVRPCLIIGSESERRCSECGAFFDKTYDEMRFCYHCGAKVVDR